MYVCKTLSAPDEYGIQTCIEWVEYQSALTLTAAQRDQLIEWFFVLMLSAFTVVIIKRIIRR